MYRLEGLMVEQRQSALQRIQVGVVGLVVVLLFVSLANMVLDRVTNEKQAGAAPSETATEMSKDATPDEPLAELGVTPIAKDDPADSPTAPVENNSRRQPPARQ
jgi:hypothetical protein